MIQHKEGEKVATQAIPTGYKQSEVGIIPEDWEALPLGGICSAEGFAFKSEKFENRRSYFTYK